MAAIVTRTTSPIVDDASLELARVLAGNVASAQASYAREVPAAWERSPAGPGRRRGVSLCLGARRSGPRNPR
jgi:hypothetical protein